MIVYRIETSFGSAGSCRFSHSDMAAPSLPRLARLMVEDDMPDGPVEGGRAGRLDWTARSLHHLATQSVAAKELAEHSEQLHPTLLAAVVSLQAKRRRAAA